MGTCKKCGTCSSDISKALSFCANCIRRADKALVDEINDLHAHHRSKFGLPGHKPSDPAGIQCGLCANKCKIPNNKVGYCGIRRNVEGQIKGGTPSGAAVSWYYDPLPTNCVADWVCPGGTGTGYPKWSNCQGPEAGYVNLAVFYQACSFDCLFCQNWHYREYSMTDQLHIADELADSVSKETACICFFGGDPTCQLPHALEAAKLALTQNTNRILRICWETNGSMAPELLDKMMDISLQSGGCVKFDLKAKNPKIHRALCGRDNRQTFENFTRAASRISERPFPPPLIASTLLVSGYIDTKEIKSIASFIAQLNPKIPYALLGFHGDFLMSDLSSTSRKFAEEALSIAKEAGLSNVRIGNLHTLQ